MRPEDSRDNTNKTKKPYTRVIKTNEKPKKTNEKSMISLKNLAKTIVKPKKTKKIKPKPL